MYGGTGSIIVVYAKYTQSERSLAAFTFCKCQLFETSNQWKRQVHKMF